MQHESSRPLRVGELLRRELSTLLRLKVNDPRIPEIVIYDIVVSKDLSLAKIYFSYQDTRRDIAESLMGLQSASGFLRKKLGQRLHLRRIPQLQFIVDDTEIKSERIERLIGSSIGK